MRLQGELLDDPAGRPGEAARRLLEPALNANYNAVRADPYPRPQTERERA